jgi:threonyl-tRNA synthetase
VQAVVIPVDNEKHGQFCKELNAKLLNNLIRSKVIDSDERLSKKIRDAQVAKIPYQLVIGDEEINSGNISFRKYGESNSTIVAVNEFIGIILQRVATKR